MWLRGTDVCVYIARVCRSDCVADSDVIICVFIAAHPVAASSNADLARQHFTVVMSMCLYCVGLSMWCTLPFIGRYLPCACACSGTFLQYWSSVAWIHYPTLMAQYSLFVLKVPLNPNQLTDLFYIAHAQNGIWTQVCWWSSFQPLSHKDACFC